MALSIFDISLIIGSFHLINALKREMHYLSLKSPVTGNLKSGKSHCQQLATGVPWWDRHIAGRIYTYNFCQDMEVIKIGKALNFLLSEE